jgi:hypothetical protein
LQRSPLPPAHQIEGKLAAHHARRFQLPAHPQRGRARRQLDKGLLRLRPEGYKNQPGRRARRQASKQGQKKPQRAPAPETLFLLLVRLRRAIFAVNPSFLLEKT